ncbi:MAG: polysaccharide deacetylase family protein [Pseudomonadota bacterium]
MSNTISLMDRVNFRLARVRNQNLRDSVLQSPVISFSYDDFPKSAIEIGAVELERHGFQGSFYPAASFCGAHEDGQAYYTEADIQCLREKGHEIGCHTHDHANLLRLNNQDIEDQFERNQAFFNDLTESERFVSMAYPFGNVSPRVKKVAQKRFPVCRGVWSGVNTGKIDMALLKVVGLDHHLTPEQTRAWIQQARDENGWLIFVAHDIQTDHTPFGVRPDTYAEIVSLVADSEIEVMTIRDAAAKAIGDPSLAMSPSGTGMACA